MDPAWMDYEVGVDISGWQVGDNINNYFIILARTSINPDGTLNGIGLAFVPNATPELDPHGYIPHPLLGFDVIKNSQPVGSGRAVVDLFSLSLDPARNYRLVFRGEGTAVQGELDEIGAGQPLIAETSTSLTEVMVPGGITIVAVDRAGVAGIANNGVSVTLDNRYATEGQAQPDLQIDPAVILTWPGWTAGFVLESAGTSEGPWHPVGTEPELTPNGNVVSVGTDSETRYFRLVRP